ncbi:MAG: class I SAM-dependent DNA methyltransferase [Chloroflexi bacterium]|nr:class I SAM-dependent DNA methyltransferase [Chloroflexota bacterium]
MDKQTAIRIIRDTFESPFDKARFIYFTKNLLNKIDETKAFHIQGHYIPESFRDYVKAYERIGTYTDHENNKIDILIVYLQKETSLERARTSQRNFVARYLKERDEKEAGLVAFVSPDEEDWRFSLVKMDYLLEESPSGKTKVRTELTPARRFSFIVGVNESSHTAQSQLVPILQDDAYNPILKQLEAAFNIEKVTKEFFEKYRELYHKVHEALEDIVSKDQKVRDDFATKAVSTVDFSKKLLGQIVFLYFLQKKGWFGVGRDKNWGTGPKNFLRLLFDKKNVSYDNFFNDVLESLFYEALAVERTDDFYSRFNCKIPFLNGGLFDPINNYDWVHADILLPNELFSNTFKTKEGDIGTGVLDVFDRYNFTVKEDEPLEKEVAIDPEMLGKVFENLLEVKDRKSKGTYYTPREIVHYMCQESLINYLDTAINTGDVPLVATPPPQGKLFGKPDPEQGTLKAPAYRAIIPREDIEAFIRMGELAIEHDARVEGAGRETRDYSYKLPESIRQNAGLIDEKLATIRICDPAIGSGAFPVGMMHEIVRARNTLTTYLPKDESRNNYNFKRHAIRNCLYGVDIDPGAVEIAKLRLWLSLVVDEEDIKQIQPLPNLDYKIVCGNSLLGVEKNLFNVDLFNELEKLKSFYFNETNAKKKQEYRKQIDQLIKNLTNNKEMFDFEVYFSEVFHEKGGFDVVIGNPPYETSRGKGIESTFKDYLRRSYETAEDKYDFYTFFIEKSSNIAKEKGHVCLITANTYLTKPLSRKIRRYLLSKCEVISIDEFKGFVFETVVPTAIILFGNKPANDNHVINVRYDINSVADFLNDNFSQRCIHQQIFVKEPDFYINVYADEWFFDFFDNLCKQDNIMKLGVLAEIYNGIQTGNDKKFVSYERRSAKWERVITGSDIQAYYKSWGGKYIYYVPELLHSNTRKTIFKTSKKIIIRQTADRIIGAYDDEGYFTLASTFVIKQFKEMISHKVLLAILNSNLFLYLYRSLNNEEGRVLPQIKKKHIFGLPIKIQFQEKPLNDLVDIILSITKDEDYLTNPAKQAQVKEYERQIDLLVYELYGLTSEEIAVMEGSNRK